MPVIMLKHRTLVLALAAAGFLGLFAACGGDDSGGSTPSTPTGSDASPTISIAPTPGGDPLVPPLEGTEVGPPVTEMTDWREEPDWQMPEPEDVPAADDPEDPALNPPAEPTCPTDWILINRPTEGFTICYPPNWVVGSHGFVSSANESRWYSLGLFDFADPENQIQRAHVSVYAFPQFARPVRYIIDCPDPLSVTLSGIPAVVCRDYPGLNPEANIISYHVYRGGLDFFLNIVSYYRYEDGEYTDTVDQEALDTAIQVAQTVKFIPVVALPETDTPTASPEQ